MLTTFYVFPLLRLLLWDCDDRSYSYYVEVSTNQQQWTMVADRTKVSCAGYSPSPGGSRLAPAAGVHPVSLSHL